MLIQMRYRLQAYLKYYWSIWAKALGKKAHENDHVADKIAVVRTVIILVYLITNFVIVAGVIRHW